MSIIFVDEPIEHISCLIFVILGSLYDIRQDFATKRDVYIVIRQKFYCFFTPGFKYFPTLHNELYLLSWKVDKHTCNFGCFILTNLFYYKLVKYVSSILSILVDFWRHCPQSNLAIGFVVRLFVTSTLNKVLFKKFIVLHNHLENLNRHFTHKIDAILVKKAIAILTNDRFFILEDLISVANEGLTCNLFEKCFWSAFHDD